jgi:hypothetical protein
MNVLQYRCKTTLANILNKSYKRFHRYFKRGESILHYSNNFVQTQIIQII